MKDQQENTDDLQVAYAERIAILIAGYIRQTLSSAEHDELDDWVAASDENMLLFEDVTDEKKMQQELDKIDKEDTARVLKKIKERLHFTREQHRPFRKFWKYAAAAALLITVTGTFLFVYKKPDTHTIPAVASTSPDVLPGGDKAILTLADGSSIVLEQAADGTLATQGSSHVIKRDGQLQYSHTTGDTPNTALLYNTVTTPRGGSYPLTLSDGTRLWLNAASSIRFPAVFTGHERKVAINGEVYFEVAKNASMPFRVEVQDRGMTVEVLGTHFNINAYTDEAKTSTTLLEGRVKVLAGAAETILKPGQQARLSATGSLDVVSDLNTEEVIAWKNGLFQFNNADITTLMRQVARWYDIEVSYAGAAPSILTTGKAPRNISLASLLKILELSGIRYKIEGKKLIVLP